MSGALPFVKSSRGGLLFFVAWAVALAAGASVHAGTTLVTYMFGTTLAANTDSLAPDTGSVPANVSAGNLTDHVEVSETTNSAFSKTTFAYFARSATLGGTEAAAVDTADPEYISFTVQAAGGYALNLSQFTFKLGSTTSTTSYTVNAALRSSVDGFAADIGTYSVTQINTSGTPAYTLQTQGLAGAQFQSLVGLIEFRIYLWDSVDDNTNYIARLDEVTLSGTVSAAAIPEPATTAAMAGLVICLAVVWRRGPRRPR